jgi:hypothetical protein
VNRLDERTLWVSLSIALIFTVLVLAVKLP